MSARGVLACLAFTHLVAVVVAADSAWPGVTLLAMFGWVLYAPAGSKP